VKWETASPFLLLKGGEAMALKRDFTPEELRENGRKGGIASGEAKRKKKAMQETLNTLLGMPLKNKKCYEVEEIQSFAQLNGKNISVETAILIKQIQRALAGDLPSAEFIRDTSGQAPTKELNVGGALPVVISGEGELED
jgi:hypothetical protein